jgi:lysophospholipase L1-like esterase
MRKIKLLLLGLLMFASAFGSSYDTIRSNNPLIEYTGRIDFSNSLTPKFSYSGVSIRASFRGTGISCILNDAGTQNYYNVILDQVVISRLQTKAGINTYEITHALKDTIHEIEIFRLTEEMFGKTQFLGFLLDKGKALVEISNKRKHLIEFIGNSITCGYGNEGINGGRFGATTENHYLTYAAFTSRALNARHLAVCKSGIGIYRNYDGPVNGSTDCMTNYYQRIFLYDEMPLYKFARKPDLICIDLGTNDFSTGKGDSARYVTKYLQFIDTLQLKNKEADILCLLGPMLSGNDLKIVRRCLHFIVDSANKKNHGNVYLFEMSEQDGKLGIGIDYHPTVAQHLKNAEELVQYISGLKHWKVYQNALR